jgi:N-acylneuraminate cytidylyltransferase
MPARRDVLAVIPAREGSQGLPGKNVRPFAGLPLIAHSIRLAKMCPEIDRCVVSTDSEEIARVAREQGGDVPFLRPPELATSDTPLWPVLRHALESVEKGDGPYRYLMLLDPTSPTRLPEHVAESVRRMNANPQADGIIAVSKPDFNPVWHGVIEKDGWMTDFAGEGARIQRRQDTPPFFRINGLLYLWRTEVVRTRASWREGTKLLLLETPEDRAFSIDTLDQFRRAEVLVQSGLLPLPWLKP